MKLLLSRPEAPDRPVDTVLVPKRRTLLQLVVVGSIPEDGDTQPAWKVSLKPPKGKPRELEVLGGRDSSTRVVRMDVADCGMAPAAIRAQGATLVVKVGDAEEEVSFKLLPRLNIWLSHLVAATALPPLLFLAWLWSAESMPVGAMVSSVVAPFVGALLSARPRFNWPGAPPPPVRVTYRLGTVLAATVILWGAAVGVPRWLLLRVENHSGSEASIQGTQLSPPGRTVWKTTLNAGQLESWAKDAPRYCIHGHGHDECAEPQGDERSDLLAMLIPTISLGCVRDVAVDASRLRECARKTKDGRCLLKVRDAKCDPIENRLVEVPARTMDGEAQEGARPCPGAVADKATITVDPLVLGEDGTPGLDRLCARDLEGYVASWGATDERTSRRVGSFPLASEAAVLFPPAAELAIRRGDTKVGTVEGCAGDDTLQPLIRGDVEDLQLEAGKSRFDGASIPGTYESAAVLCLPEPYAGREKLELYFESSPGLRASFGLPAVSSLDASIRVKDSAEASLTCVRDAVGQMPDEAPSIRRVQKGDFDDIQTLTAELDAWATRWEAAGSGAPVVFVCVAPGSALTGDVEVNGRRARLHAGRLEAVGVSRAPCYLKDHRWHRATPPAECGDDERDVTSRQQVRHWGEPAPPSYCTRLYACD